MTFCPGCGLASGVTRGQPTCETCGWYPSSDRTPLYTEPRCPFGCENTFLGFRPKAGCPVHAEASP